MLECEKFNYKLSWTLPILRGWGRGKIPERVALQEKYGLSRIEIPAHTIYGEKEQGITRQEPGEILSNCSINKLYNGNFAGQENRFDCILHTEYRDYKIHWNWEWWRKDYYDFLDYLKTRLEHFGGKVCGIEIHTGVEKDPKYKNLLIVVKDLRMRFDESKILIENRPKQIISDADTFKEFFDSLIGSGINSRDVGFVVDILQLKTRLKTKGGRQNLFEELKKLEDLERIYPDSILGWHIHSGSTGHKPITDEDGIQWDCWTKFFSIKRWYLPEVQFERGFKETIDYIEKRIK